MCCATNPNTGPEGVGFSHGNADLTDEHSKPCICCQQTVVLTTGRIYFHLGSPDVDLEFAQQTLPSAP
jgi:hypothetical protein